MFRRSRKQCLNATTRLHGCPSTSSTDASASGSRAQETGLSAVTASGVTRFLYGSVTVRTILKLLGLLKSLRRSVDRRLMTSISTLSTPLLGRVPTERARCAVFQISSTAGLNPAPCRMLSSTIPSRTRRTGISFSLQTSSTKASIRQEDGSIH